MILANRVWPRWFSGTGRILIKSTLLAVWLATGVSCLHGRSHNVGSSTEMNGFDTLWQGDYAKITNGEYGYGAFAPTNAITFQREFSERADQPVYATNTHFLLTYAVGLLCCASSDTTMSPQTRGQMLHYACDLLGSVGRQDPVAMGHLAWAYREGLGVDEDLVKSEMLLREGLTVVPTNRSPRIRADLLGNLAVVLGAMYRSDEALEVGKQALGLREVLLGYDHPDVVVSLERLTDLCEAAGKYAEAETYMARIYEIRKRQLGSGNPIVALTLGRRGELCREQGDYAKATDYYREALSLLEQTPEETQMLFAACLVGAGDVHSDIGERADAIRCYEHALMIQERTLGEEDDDVIGTLKRLGYKHLQARNTDKAEEYFQRAFHTVEKKYGGDARETADALGDLASVALTKGTVDKSGGDYQQDFDKAEQYFQRDLAIVEKTGSDDLALVRPLRALSFLYLRHRKYGLAQEYARRSLDIFIRRYGADDPNTCEALQMLGIVSYWIGDGAEALRCCASAAELAVASVDNAFVSLSERQRMLFWDTRIHEYVDVMLSLATTTNSVTSSAMHQSCLWTFRSKGSVAASMMQDRRLVRDTPDVMADRQSLRQIETTIAELVFDGEGATTDEQHARRKARIDELSNEAETLEIKLARHVAPIRERHRVVAVSVDQVRNAVPINDALIEIVRFGMVPAPDREEHDASLHYAAIILSHASTNPIVLSLGNAEAIDAQVHRCQAAMRAGEPVAGILTGLYAQVWAPLAKYVQGCRRVIVSPDGELNFLPFAALIAPDGKYLCEHHEIGYVASGRDLIKRFDEPATNTPSLFGDPAFGDEEKPGDYLDRSLAFRSVFHDKDRDVLGGMHFPQLPGTRKEVESLKGVFDSDRIHSVVYLGREATEGQLKALSRPEILHLATHGFFLPDIKEEASDPTQMMSVGPRGGTRSFPVRIENPMLRSGLALTGAALSLAKKGETSADKDDGIVTAEEVGSLDLWGTKLVVLSACDTGMGEARAGQGVLGLRRAFAQAGVQNLMMTLWPVQDDATGQLMVEFYRKYLATNDAIGAINAVQRAAIATARQKGEQPNPRVWAPFLVSVQGKAGQLSK